MVDIKSLLTGAAGGATVAIVIKAIDQYSAEIKNAGEATKGLSNFAIVAKGAFLAAAAAVGVFVADGVQQAMAYQQVLQRTGFVFGASSERIIAASKAMAAQFIPTDEEILSGFNKMQLALEDLGVTADHQMKLMTAALNISAASGDRLEVVLDNLTRGIQGNTRGLKQYGIIIKDGSTSQDIFNELLAKGTELQGAAAKSTESFAGKVSQLTEEWDDFKKEIGMLVIPVLDWLITKVNQFLLGVKAAGMMTALFLGQLNSGASIQEAATIAFNDTVLILAAEKKQLEEVTQTTATLAPIQNALTESVKGTTEAFKQEKDSLIDLEKQAWQALAPMEKLTGLSMKGVKAASKIKKGVQLGEQEISPGVFVQKGNPQGISVKDFIITKTGQLIKTDPSDTIMGVKNPSRMGSNVTINISAHDAREVADKVSRMLAQDFFIRVSG